MKLINLIGDILGALALFAIPFGLLWLTLWFDPIEEPTCKAMLPECGYFEKE